MKIAVHAFDGMTMFHLAAPLLVFRSAVQLGLAPGWETTVWTMDPTPVHTADGIAMGGLSGPDAAETADLLIFPSWPVELPAPSENLIALVQRAHERGAQVAGLCLGAFPVAGSGVLDSRTAVTHWAATDALASQNPAVEVQATAIYIDHGDVLTSAGTASALDACLHIVRTRLGSAAAATIARHCVVAPHRNGDQAQFIERPVADSHEPGPIGTTIEWALANLEQDLSVSTLATQACMSRRNFTRRFHEATGSTPATWVLSRRLDAARSLLETSSLSIERIAAECGFSSPVTFRQNFVRRFATTPTTYRVGVLLAGRRGHWAV